MKVRSVIIFKLGFSTKWIPFKRKNRDTYLHQNYIMYQEIKENIFFYRGVMENIYRKKMYL